MNRVVRRKRKYSPVSQKKRGVDLRFSQFAKRHIRRRTCDFYASGTSPFRALATLRAAAVIVRSSTFTVTSAYFS